VDNSQVKSIPDDRLTRRQKARAIYPLVVRLGTLWDEYLRLLAREGGGCNGSILDVPVDAVELAGYSSEQVAVNAHFLSSKEAHTFHAGDTLCVFQRSSYNPAIVQVSQRDLNGKYWVYSYGTLGSPSRVTGSLPSDAPTLQDKIDMWNTPVVFTEIPIYLEGELDVNQFALLGNYGSTGRRHPGFDFFAPPGTTPVLAAADGIVIGYYDGSQNAFHGPESYLWGMSPTDLQGEPARNDFSGREAQLPGGNTRYGRDYVVVQHGDVIVVYAHLEPGSVEVGDRVFAGQAIGRVGQHGGGSHLHFETRIFRDRVNLVSDGYPSPANVLVFLDPLNVYSEDIVQGITLAVPDRVTVAIEITGDGVVLHKIDPTRSLGEVTYENGYKIVNYPSREEALNAIRQPGGPVVEVEGDN